MINKINRKQKTEKRNWNLKSILTLSSRLVDGCAMRFRRIDYLLLTTSRVPAFTLIETMVGIVIIVTAIMGPLSVAISSSAYARDTKDKITAIYLAQEAADVLRFERDSLLIKCSQNLISLCTLNDLNGVYGINSFETTSNAAWRMFKSNLDIIPSCFVTVGGNEPGCSFDFYGFTKNTSLPPTKYLPTDSNCNYLFRDETGGSTGGAYLCKVSGDPLLEPSFQKTKFSRVIKLTHIETVSGGSQYYQDYNDDVRVNVTVSYAKSYGLPKTVEVVDFLHAKI